MHSFILAALITAAAASPLRSALSPRATASTCSIQPQQPFKLQAKGGQAAGNYASLENSGFKLLQFDVEDASNAATFTLDDDNHLIVGTSNPNQFAYELLGDKAGTILVDKQTKVRNNTIVSCTINATTCALECSSDEYSSNFVCSHFAEWRISTLKANPHGDTGDVCSKFTPIAVA